MPEENVKQKFLRVARRVLTTGPQSVGDTYVANFSSRSYSLPSRFPPSVPSRVRGHIPRQLSQPAVSTNHDIFPFRFSDLPIEILQHIFICCAEPSVGDSPVSKHHKVSPEWLPITQVCRSWRSVAHACPPLWSMITPNLNVHWVDVMQQRSKPLLLDVHLRVGSRDIDDRQPTMTIYAALIILQHISSRMRSLRLDGPRVHLEGILSNLHTPSSLQSLSINIPLWDLATPFSIPETLFSSQAPLRSLSFSADRALRAPDWLLRGLTSFKVGGKVPLENLLDSLRQMPVLKHFTLLKCTAVWNEVDVFPGAPIPMERLEEFIVRTESPRHFVLLAMRLAIPEGARKRLAVSTLAAPNYGLWSPWLEALPPLYAALTRGGLQHIHISGGPTRGRFLTWTDGLHDDLARFCFELEWNGSPPAPGGVRAIELTSPFYHLHVLCHELNAAGVRRVLVEGDPAHIDVAEGYWHQLLVRLPSVEELWLYPGTVKVLESACAARDNTEGVLQSLKRVYVIEGRLSAPEPAGPATASGSNFGGPFAEVEWNGSPIQPQASLVSPQSKSGFISAKGGVMKRKGSHNPDATPGLMALLSAAAAPQSIEIHLRNCDVENGALKPLCALTNVRRNGDWVLLDT